MKKVDIFKDLYAENDWFIGGRGKYMQVRAYFMYRGKIKQKWKGPI
jgi:hypothetical protein